MRENRDSGVWGSAFCTRTLWCKSRIFSGTRQRNNYRHQNFFNFCLLPKPVQRWSVPISPFVCFPSALPCFWGRVSIVISWKTGCRRLAYGDKQPFTPTLTLVRLIIQTLFSAPTGNPRRPRPGGSTHCCCEVATTVGKVMTKTTSELWGKAVCLTAQPSTGGHHLPPSPTI